MDKNQLIVGCKKEVVVIENLQQVDEKDPKSLVLVDSQTFTIEYLDEQDDNLSYFEPQNVLSATIGEDGEVPIGSSSAKCIICSRCYISVYDKKRHELSHFEIRPYACQYCSKHYILSSKYYTHSCTNNSKERIHPVGKNNSRHIPNYQAYCHICEEVFENLRELQVHERILHTKELPHECGVCKQRFSSSNEINEHYCNISIHTNSRKDKLKCKKCRKHFVDYEALNSHFLGHYVDGTVGFYGIKDVIIAEHWENLKKYTESSSINQQFDDNNLSIEDNSQLNNFIENVYDNDSIIDVYVGSAANHNIKCDYCNKQFPTELEMLQHQVKHFTFKPKKCEQCSKLFILTTDFFKHDCVKNFVTRDLRKKCNICFNSFLLPNLKVHERVHTGEVLFSKSTSFNGTLRNIKLNSKDICERNGCIICQKAFNSLKQLDIHLLHHYVEDNKYEYLLKDSLNRLIKDEYEDRLTSEFNNKNNLTEHSINDDGLSQEFTNNDELISNTSNDSFSDNIDTSRETQSPLNPSDFLTSNDITSNHLEQQCGICYKIFEKDYEKKLHQLDHFGIKPYRCEFCSQYFAMSSQYYNHNCSKLSKRRRSHPRPKTTSTKFKNINGFVCHICWKIFTRFDTLRRHESVHTGERPFQCKDCGKLFSQWSGKDRHLCITNNDIKVADTTCDKCGRIFKNSKYLDIHEQTHYFVGQTNLNYLPDLYSIKLDNEVEIV